jgi:predicted CoA-substrate-specific enzyme activase
MKDSLQIAIGIDLGSVAIKATVLDAKGRVHRQHQRSAKGPVLKNIEALLSEVTQGMDAENMALGVTGGAKSVFDGFGAAHRENDLVASIRAAAAIFPEIQSIIEVGGHQSKWARLGAGGTLESFFVNDQCAAGSGAFLEQQATRLNVDIERFSAMAAGAARSATIAGRCAVFTKSDMIHQQQKGVLWEEIAYGLCLALARNFQANMLRGRELVVPALFIGGGALNAGLYRAFLEVFGLSEKALLKVRAAQFFAAHGVALGALVTEKTTSVDEVVGFLERSSGFKKNTKSKYAALRPSDAVDEGEPRLCASSPVSAYLGVDVGSVSTNLCLLSPQGKVLDAIYLKTKGDPIGSLGEGMVVLRDRAGEYLNVLGVGTTGSGRHLAGKLLGADVVKNEITCQVLGAWHVLPQADTIFEIGGQDSKFISVKDGHAVDFTMNKICAAGTGSFIEEQSETLGVAIKGEFAKLAMKSRNPLDLGSQCTVFVDTEVVNACQEGAPLPDILSGLAYSVARNYLDRVVAGRTIGNEIVFQGGVASNSAVVSAFETILAKPIKVHPQNRVSGAIGAALAAKEQMQGQPSRFRGLNAVDSVDVRTFECKACSNMCQVSRVRLGEAVTFFGDVCERYTARESKGETARPPDLFREIEELLDSYAGGQATLGVAGIPRTLTMMDLLPFWATLLRSLGFRVVLSEPSTARLLEAGTRRLTAETCLPVKLVYGHVASLMAQEGIDFVLLPSIMEITDCYGAKSHMCPFEETVGFMVGTFAADRMVIPTVTLSSPRPKLVRKLRQKLSTYDFSEEQISEALDAAFAAQGEFYEKLRKRGAEVLSQDLGLAFAVIGKPYNVIDPFENLNLAQHIRRLGILPIPMQMLPVETNIGEDQEAQVPWTYNRSILRCVAEVSRDDRLFPVVVSNFGCGPDAFAMKHLDDSAQGTPYLFLEFDEHRGEAGLITRLEAFIDEVSHWYGRRESKRVSLGLPPRRRHEDLMGHRFVIPYFADHAWAFLGALRFASHEALLLPPPDENSLAYGEAISSGKECHPYVVIAGDLLKHVDTGVIRDGDIFIFPGTTVPCLLQEYGSAMCRELDRAGKTGVAVMTPTGSEHFDILGAPGMVRLGRGLLACDLLTKVKCSVRPYAADAARVDELFANALELLAKKLAEDRMGEALRQIRKEVKEIEKVEQPRRPLVGVAGDTYTRIHPLGNQGLFNRLEELGLEVWPAPLILDVIEFGWRRQISEDFDDGRYLDSFTTAMLFLRKEMESRRVRFMWGNPVEMAGEPGYREVLSRASPYMDEDANEMVLLNIAKMVDYAKRGAAGIINAISFHCMLGTVSASITDRIRQDHGMLPITTMVYSGKATADTDAKLEAFAHQVKSFAKSMREGKKHGSWLSAFWD